MTRFSSHTTVCLIALILPVFYSCSTDKKESVQVADVSTFIPAIDSLNATISKELEVYTKFSSDVNALPASVHDNPSYATLVRSIDGTHSRLQSARETLTVSTQQIEATKTALKSGALSQEDAAKQIEVLRSNIAMAKDLITTLQKSTLMKDLYNQLNSTPSSTGGVSQPIPK